MIRWLRLGPALLVGWAGAALWAYGIAVLQPLCEPGSPYWEYAENNSYWARDVRWAAILAVAAGLAAAAGRSWVVATAVPGVAADLVLDRIDPGRPALMPAALIAGVVVSVAAVVAARRSPRPGGRPLAAWIVAACVLGAGMIRFLESPSDSEPQLGPARLAAAAVLTAAAVLCVGTRLPAGAGPRRWVALATVPAGLALAGPPVPAALALVLLAVVAGVALRLSEPWPGPVRTVAALVAYGVVLVGVTALLIFVMLGAAGPFTALAGNQAIDSADSDMSLMLLAVVVAAVWTVAASVIRQMVADGDEVAPAAVSTGA